MKFINIGLIACISFFSCAPHSSLLTNKGIPSVKGKINKSTPTLVRVHSECLTGDLFGSQRCDCGSQLDAALEMITNEGSGVLLYLV